MLIGDPWRLDTCLLSNDYAMLKTRYALLARSCRGLLSGRSWHEVVPGGVLAHHGTLFSSCKEGREGIIIYECASHSSNIN